jgi:hydroxymethylglutaryl-CoA reductase (NADPH)
VQNYLVVTELAGQKIERNCFVKSKKSALHFYTLVAQVLCDAGLPLSYDQTLASLRQSPYLHSDIKEVELYRLLASHPKLARYFPDFYGDYTQIENETFILVEGAIAAEALSVDVNDSSLWSAAAIAQAMQDYGALHSVFYGRTEVLSSQVSLPYAPTLENIQALKPLWQAYLDFAKQKHNAFLEDVDISRHEQIFSQCDHWFAELSAMKKTLVYNDDSPKNLAYLRTENRLCLFDWEMATIDIPQRDTAEFLSYTLQAMFDRSVFLSLIEQHRKSLEAQSGHVISSSEWRRGFLLALYALILDRVSLYLVVDTFEQRNLPAVYRNMQRMISILEEEAL